MTESYYQLAYRNYQAQNPPRKMRFYRSLLQRFMPTHAASLLDIGCAYGYFLSTLPDTLRGVGIDLHWEALREGKSRAPRAAFVAGDTAVAPLSGQFDVVVAFDSLEHINDLAAVLNLIHTSLRPGGIVIIVVPVYDGPLGPVIHFLDKDPTHVHKCARGWWYQKLDRQFQILHTTGVFRYLLWPGVYLHWPCSWLKRIAPAVAIVARKNA